MDKNNKEVLENKEVEAVEEQEVSFFEAVDTKLSGLAKKRLQKENYKLYVSSILNNKKRGAKRKK